VLSFSRRPEAPHVGYSAEVLSASTPVRYRFATFAGPFEN
jgi:hypothetical protein